MISLMKLAWPMPKLTFMPSIDRVQQEFDGKIRIPIIIIRIIRI